MTTPLWTPNPNTFPHTHLYQFIQFVNKYYHLSIKDYDALYQWSIDCPEDFWRLAAEFCGIQFSQQPSHILQKHPEMQKTKWFIDAKLNFAENLLSRKDSHTALIYANEAGIREKITYAELSLRVHALAEKLKSWGLQAGDRVAGLVTNRIETVIAMLATTLQGAIWTACGPEFGLAALLDRFVPLSPSILFVVTEYQFGGKKISLNNTIDSLTSQLPSVKKIISLDEFPRTHTHTHTHSVYPFDHPLYVLFSSGTTGKPKCMVHGAGNVLIQHKKELMLHTDLHENDILFFYTTCSWMMWHWMISGLSVGATLVLYDGSPFYPNTTAIFDLIDELSISIVGCGAKIIETCLKNNVVPRKTHQLSDLKTIVTTGSPLIKESFDYLYRDVKKDVRVSSISGGSDIVSCFALGNPLLPVYTEELQCRGLGMKVEIFDEDGDSIHNQPGELVCTQAFPSMPIYFWNDESGEQYFHAYFDRFKNVWTHGDYAKLTEHQGIIIYGRSDATLNPGGVRIGTADIYEQVLKIPAVMDCLAAGKQKNGDEEIILFVKLKNAMTLDEQLIGEIKKMIRDNTTPFHVPKKIIAVSDIPKTLNGKTMEIAVKNIINGRPVKNWEVIANPACLDEFKQI